MAGCLRLNYRYLASQKCHALGRGALLLPGVHQSDLITGEDSINRDKFQAFCLSLGNQQAVKRVFVNHGKQAGQFGMVGVDRKRRKTFIFKARCQLSKGSKFTNPFFMAI